MMKYRYLFIILLCFTADNIYAQITDFTKGMAAFNAKDYKTAITQLTPYAQKGSCTAQYAVGFAYANDYDIKNDSLAIHWLTLAAEQKHTKAMGALAECYFMNDKLRDHLLRAYLWSMLAATYDPTQQFTTTTLMIRAYIKPDDLARGNGLVNEYENRWNRKPNCQ